MEFQKYRHSFLISILHFLEIANNRKVVNSNWIQYKYKKVQIWFVVFIYHKCRLSKLITIVFTSLYLLYLLWHVIYLQLIFTKKSFHTHVPGIGREFTECWKVGLPVEGVDVTGLSTVLLIRINDWPFIFIHVQRDQTVVTSLDK